jgi:hypothetical protein
VFAEQGRRKESNIMTIAPGLATQAIDDGFDIKRPLCEAIDIMCGLDPANLWTWTGNLRCWYVFRRPSFVMTDIMWST